MTKAKALSKALEAGTDEELTVQSMIEKSARLLKDSLPSGMGEQRLIRIAMTCLRQTPGLAECYPPTILGALLVSAQLGLEPLLGRAWILPFWNKKTNRYEAQLLMGYKGYAELFYRHEKSMTLMWGKVRDGDFFKYEKGTNAYIRHIPEDDPEKPPGEITHYYVIAVLSNGSPVFEVMMARDCIAHGKKHSKSYDQKVGKFLSDSPWNKDTDAMCLKTVFIQLSKLLPLSFEMQRAIAQDESSREYTPTIEDILDVPDTGGWPEGEPEESPYLETGTPLHKAFEAMIAEQELDRNLLHEFLYATNRLDSDDPKDLSFKGVKEVTVKMALDNPKKFKQEFAKWASLIKGD